MKINEIRKGEKDSNGVSKCWPGYHAAGTKKGKNGGQVRNCVPNESVAEGAESLSDWETRMKKLGYKITKDNKSGTYHAWDGTTHKGSHKTQGVAEAGSPAQQAAIAINMKKNHKKPKKMDENFGDDMTNIDPPERDEGEGSFVKNQIHTMIRVLSHLERAIGDDEDLPEWVEMKLSQAQGMVVGVMDFMISDKEREMEHNGGEEPYISESMTPDQQFDIIEAMVESLAQAHGVDAEQIWEDLESFDDVTLLSESAAWHRKEGKSAKGGLNRKGVASYRREHPGSHLQMAVTTKPSKLKAGSKAAKRRKSFCARMSGCKGPMEKNGKPTRKALALRKWHC